MRALLKRLFDWFRRESCGWCDGTGVHPRALRSYIKADASCIECRGTGRLVKD